MNTTAQEWNEHIRLVRAVEALYFAGYWHADRNVDERGLWTEVRDAAGIKPGQTSERLGPDRTPSSIGEFKPSTTVDASDVQLLRNISHCIGMLRNADYGTVLANQGMLERDLGRKLSALIQRVEKDLVAAGEAEVLSWGA